MREKWIFCDLVPYLMSIECQYSRHNQVKNYSHAIEKIWSDCEPAFRTSFPASEDQDMNEYKLDTLANKVNLKRTKLFIHASFRILDRQYICSYEERYHETLVLLTERCK